MITFRNILAAAIAAGSLAGMSAPAHAGGFLADTFIRPFSLKLADAVEEESYCGCFGCWGNVLPARPPQPFSCFAPNSAAAVEFCNALSRRTGVVF